ncbi:glycosyltransferase family 4 protein [Neolewinella litorea]|uniref:Glycosyltransferase family 1 protein n=1 Tax=Neolewinella litorea TaxID=2562452 RepID=A0A4S4NNF5_9BACT|nr:glycosyltransferase family 1 protein [Neolewinella litorea]THH39911.1 glycosyltransferase family 1 protein [Neolewinella litorea]
MRLGYDAKRLFHNSTGLGNYSRTLLTNLQATHPEFEYFLYSPQPSHHPYARPFRDNPAYTLRCARGLVKPIWRSYGMVRQLTRDRVELYHGLSHELPFRLAKRGARSVVTIHDLIFKRHPEWYPAVDRWIYDWKVRHACRRADRIIAISEHTKRDITDYYGVNPAKIDVVYQSCDPLFYEDGGTSPSGLERYDLPEQFLLFVGSLTPRKNLPLVLDALLQLRTAEQLPLVVVGRGSKYRAQLMRQERYRPLHSLIHWIGDLDDNRLLKALYRRSRAVVYPSHYEGFGLPVAEALLSGTAVITSTASSLPEAAGPGAILVDPNRPAQMAQAIRDLLHNDTLRNRLIEEGGTYAREQFGAAATTRALVASYRRALAGE